MGSHIRHRMFSIVDRTQLIGGLLHLGLSAQGAGQLLDGEVVSSFGDRLKLAGLVRDQANAAAPTGLRLPVAVDPSDPSGNTIYVTSAGVGVWKVSHQGTQQFFSGLPVTDAHDRQRLSQLFAEALGQD